MNQFETVYESYHEDIEFIPYTSIHIQLKSMI